MNTPAATTEAGDVLQSNLEREHPMPKDGNTIFYAEPHIYIHNRIPARTSVTKMLKNYWPEFDAQEVISTNFARWKNQKNNKYSALIRYLQLVQGKDDRFCKEAIEQFWKAEADEASKAGTCMHAHFQCEVEGWPLPDDETVELRIFRRWIADFCKFHDLTVWRSEWCIVHEYSGVPVVAGQVDLLLKCKKDNSFWAVDYKRTSPVPKYVGGPQNILNSKMIAFENGRGPFGRIQATDFNKYTAQLNAYGYIANENYGIDFRDRMFVVQIHPLLTEAHCVHVSRMDEQMHSIFRLEEAIQIQAVLGEFQT